MELGRNASYVVAPYQPRQDEQVRGIRVDLKSMPLGTYNMRLLVAVRPSLVVVVRSIYDTHFLLCYSTIQTLTRKERHSNAIHNFSAFAVCIQPPGVRAHACTHNASPGTYGLDG